MLVGNGFVVRFAHSSESSSPSLLEAWVKGHLNSGSKDAHHGRVTGRILCSPWSASSLIGALAPPPLRRVGPPSQSEGADDVVLEHQSTPYVVHGVEAHAYLPGGDPVMSVFCAVSFILVNLFCH